MWFIILNVLVFQAAAEVSVTTNAAGIDTADLVLEDIEGFGPHGWSYSEKEWFNYIQDFSEISTVINKHPDTNLAAYNWDQFDSGTYGLWFFVHQLSPVLNPPEPEIRYNPGSGSAKYHHLLISYKINGAGRIDVFVSSEKTPLGVIRNDCLDSCPPGFQHAMIPLSDPDFEIGVHSFRLGFNTTNVGDFILIDRIIAFANRSDLTLPTGVTFPSTPSMPSTISTTRNPSTTESSVTEICQCWNSTCRPEEILEDEDSPQNTFWKPHHTDLMEYFANSIDLVQARDWSDEIKETLQASNFSGVWLIEYIANETITWRPDFYLSSESGYIKNIDTRYLAYGNASILTRYRLKGSTYWTNLEDAGIETETDNWATIRVDFPHAFEIQVLPEILEDDGFILIEKITGDVDCTKNLQEAKKPYEMCTCFTITTSTPAPSNTSSSTNTVVTSTTTVGPTSPPPQETSTHGGSCGIAQASLFLLILAISVGLIIGG